MVGILLAVTTYGAVGRSADGPPGVVAPQQVVTPEGFAPGTRALGVDEATPLWASVPLRIQISAIGVDSRLMKLGLDSNGRMEVPPSGFPAGWYTGASTPGEMGPAIIAGHVDWKGPGVFYDLHRMKVDDEIEITREDGSVVIFRVTDVEQYPKDEFPTALVYGPIAHAGLRLVTCGGEFNRSTGHYEDNLVVYAQLVRSVLPDREPRRAW